MKSTSCQIAKEKVFLIRLDRGEEIVTSLLKFIQEKKLKGGFLFGIGAVDKAKLAHYSVSKKRYTEKEFRLPFELTSLQGNLAFLMGKPLLHLHATFAKKDFSLLGGHLVEARISGTGEIIFFPFTKKQLKAFDQETGLNIFKI